LNWRTGVRIGLAAIGLGVAATVYVKSRNAPPPPVLPATATKLDPNVSLLSGEGKMLSYDGDKLSLEIAYKSSTSYVDGRVRLEGAVIKGLGESAFTLRTTALETKGPAVAGAKPTEFTLTGPFTFEGSDGMVVEATAGSYDDTKGTLDIPGAVTFRRGRMSGTSTGAKYDRAADTVNLLAAANATVAPDAQGKGAAQASSTRMSLVRGQHSLLMDENARIVGEAQVMSAQKATVLFTEDESAIKFLELRGAANVTPASSTATGQPRMSANDLTMAFYPDGVTMQHATLTGQAVLTTTDAGGSRSINASWIDLFTGKDGQTVTKLEARDKVLVEIPATKTTSARTITSATLTAGGDEKRGLTSARFEGSPCFREGGVAASAASSQAAQPRDPGPCAAPARGGPKPLSATAAPTTRTGSATTLVLKLAGQLDAIQEAEFQQNAVFEDGRVSAKADVARYDDAKDVLFLKPNASGPRRVSSVQTVDLTVDAAEIDVFLETENLAARGSVKTRTAKRPESKKKPAGSLFEGDEPVYGTADSLDYVKESGKAVYLGSARSLAHLQQGKTDIGAIRLEFTESTNNLVAIGQVESAIFMTAPTADSKAEAKPQVYRVNAETLTYDDARRVAVYEAPLVVLTTEDGTRTESRKLTFELAKESRALDRMRAEGADSGVFAMLPGGYEAKGDQLVYRADTDLYNITGKPAIVKSPDKEGSCKKTVSIILELNRKTGAVSLPGTSPAPSSTAPIGCAESIRTIKK
jgi:lipopolysaccharide export system protein LptA